MTSAFKEYVNIKNSLKRLSYRSFLEVQKDLVEYHLEFSLMFDGRFYGAEWMVEDEDPQIATTLLYFPYKPKYELNTKPNSHKVAHNRIDIN